MIPRTTRDWMAVLWPSFLGACIIELLVFAAFDPGYIQMFGRRIELSMQGAYTSAFFLFWMACTVVSLFTWNLLRTPAQVNQDSVDDRSLRAGTRHVAGNPLAGGSSDPLVPESRTEDLAGLRHPGEVPATHERSHADPLADRPRTSH